MHRRTPALVLAAALALATPAVPIDAGSAAPTPPAGAAAPATKQPVAVGRGGAVSSVDLDASKAGLAVLRNGGNAVDAAVATAAALGVTEPFSAGVGGGGYFVYYDAKSGKVHTLDGRETAPAAMPKDAFIDPATGQPYRFTPELVTSGVSVGVPGTPETWTTALRRWGKRSLPTVLAPATRLADDGFVVDGTFNRQVSENRVRFEAFTSTEALYLPGGQPPAVGSRFRNPDLADTYRQFARNPRLFERGRLAGEIVDAVQHPPTTDDTDLPVPPGYMTRRDLADYDVKAQAPTAVRYRGLGVYGMAPSSSGGSTVGEALNILEGTDLGAQDDADVLHRYLEASALAFADRAKYVGDPAFVDVPLADLLSQKYGDERACRIDPAHAATKPVVAGDVDDYDGRCTDTTDATGREDVEPGSTTHLTTADRWGNVVSYTLTIEQTGGSGIVVPDRGFILNNELTDFTAVYNEADPNRIQPGKRPRSSMSPTIVLRDGKPWLALGSPGGSTIITTVLQVLLNRIDRGMTLPQAVADPRGSQRNTAAVTAEQEFIDTYGPLLQPYGHTFAAAGQPGTSAAEIGAVAAIEFGRKGLLTAAAEPRRRGGGSALVVSPR